MQQVGSSGSGFPIGERLCIVGKGPKATKDLLFLVLMPTGSCLLNFILFQMATKLVINLKKIPYTNRLQRLKLPTLKYRRLRGDMIEVFR